MRRCKTHHERASAVHHKRRSWKVLVLPREQAQPLLAVLGVEYTQLEIVDQEHWLEHVRLGVTVTLT